MVAFGRRIRINALDLILLLLVLAFTLFLLFRPRGEHVLIEYELLLTVDAATADALTVGETLLDGVGKGACGRIVSARREAVHPEARLCGTKAEDAVRLRLTVRGEGKRKNGILTVGTLTPLTGKHVFLHAPATAEGVCLGVQEVRE